MCAASEAGGGGSWWFKTSFRYIPSDFGKVILKVGNVGMKFYCYQLW